MVIQITARIIANLIVRLIDLLLIAGICYIIIRFIEIISRKEKKGYKSNYSFPKQSKIDNINAEYYNSTYYLSTHIPLNVVFHDKGRYGEYMIFKELQICEKYGSRFLFNCYIPKENNQTTEIDVILLTLNGIFVFESKNYRGWVYGSENQDLWTLTMPAGNRIRKEYFYNPIIQNKSHINALKKLIGNNLPVYSVIVFSNNCRLKNIRASDPMTKVISFGYLKTIVTHLLNQRPNSLTQETLISIYNKLYPYTQVPEEVKKKHVENIRNKIRI